MHKDTKHSSVQVSPLWNVMLSDHQQNYAKNKVTPHPWYLCSPQHTVQPLPLRRLLISHVLTCPAHPFTHDWKQKDFQLKPSFFLRSSFLRFQNPVTHSTKAAFARIASLHLKHDYINLTDIFFFRLFRVPLNNFVLKIKVFKFHMNAELLRYIYLISFKTEFTLRGRALSSSESRISTQQAMFLAYSTK